jgi:hypothetical protein
MLSQFFPTNLAIVWKIFLYEGVEILDDHDNYQMMLRIDIFV